MDATSEANASGGGGAAVAPARSASPPPTAALFFSLPRFARQFNKLGGYARLQDDREADLLIAIMARTFDNIYESATLNYQLQLAVVVLASLDDSPVPSPLSLLSLPYQPSGWEAQKWAFSTGLRRVRPGSRAALSKPGMLLVYANGSFSLSALNESSDVWAVVDAAHGGPGLARVDASDTLRVGGAELAPEGSSPGRGVGGLERAATSSCDEADGARLLPPTAGSPSAIGSRVRQMLPRQRSRRTRTRRPPTMTAARSSTSCSSTTRRSRRASQ